MEMVVLTALVSFWTFGTSKCLEIKIGLLLNEGGCCDYKNLEDKASAINIALDQLYLDGVWDRNITLRYMLLSQYCHYLISSRYRARLPNILSS